MAGSKHEADEFVSFLEAIETVKRMLQQRITTRQDLQYTLGKSHQKKCQFQQLILWFSTIQKKIKIAGIWDLPALKSPRFFWRVGRYNQFSWFLPSVYQQEKFHVCFWQALIEFLVWKWYYKWLQEVGGRRHEATSSHDIFHMKTTRV